MTYFGLKLKQSGVNQLAKGKDKCGAREKEVARNVKDAQYFEQVFLNNSK
jgi:hypothetical protein